MNIIQDENHISYELNSTNQTVKVVQSPEVQGDIFIPRSIKHNTVDYLITKIGNKAFSENKKIQSISFSKDSEISCIGSDSFSETKISKIVIPDSVTKIEQNAFCWCHNLTTIEISPNSKLESFIYSCSIPVTHIYIPPHLRFDGGLLSNFTKLESITISPQNKNYMMYDNNNILLGKSDDSCENFDTIIHTKPSITHVSIPPTIKIIGKNAFRNCFNLQAVDFPPNSTLEKILNYAFRSCYKLKSIKLPASLKEIYNEAFYDCSSLRTISFCENSNLEEIGINAFHNCGI